jgi:hypothetical protein
MRGLSLACPQIAEWPDASGLDSLCCDLMGMEHRSGQGQSVRPIDHIHFGVDHGRRFSQRLHGAALAHRRSPLRDSRGAPLDAPHRRRDRLYFTCGDCSHRDAAQLSVQDVLEPSAWDVRNANNCIPPNR